MNEILQIIVEYASIWAPSIVAVLSIVCTVIPAVIKVSEALKRLKEDKTLAEVGRKLETLASDNEELVRCNKLLLDKITKIQNYADHKKEE